MRRIENVRRLELRRHARRDPDADRLSAEGRSQAEDLGRSLTGAYDVVFVSPAERTAETVAWILRGAGLQLPDHAVLPGLAGEDESAGTPESMAEVVRNMLGRIPEGGRGLAVSHTPFVERAALGLSGHEIEPVAECEGILVTETEDGEIEVVELRLGSGSD